MLTPQEIETLFFRKNKQSPAIVGMKLKCYNRIHSTDITQEQLFHWYYSLNENPKCNTCNGDVKFDKFSTGYSRFCCNKCAQQNLEIKNKKKETILKKYGVENPMQHNKIKQKYMNTVIERYGGVFNQEKSKETLMKNYGVIYPMQSDKVINTMKQNNILKYGVPNVSQDKRINRKIQETKEKRYGQIHPDQKSDYGQYCLLVDKYTTLNQSYVIDIEKRKQYEFDLDHKFSKHMGFTLGILPIIIGSKYNLEILEYKYNRTIKREKCSINLQELLENFEKDLINEAITR